MGEWRSHVDRALTSLVMAPLLRPLQRGIGSIFMLHRFKDSRLGVAGHEPEHVRACIRFLHRNGYRTRSALAMIRDALRGDDVSRCVAFTVDDGYRDFETVGGPLFRDLGVPVTLFVATGMVDRHGWFWWDRVHAAFEATERSSVEFDTHERKLTLRLGGTYERAASAEVLIGYLKRLSRSRIDQELDRLLVAVDVHLPERPPPRYTVMDWSGLRTLADRGVEFGPHTVNHTILSKVSPEIVRTEVTESWRRLQQELPGAAVPLFCYPNGTASDYGSRDFDALADAGIEAAVTAEPGYLTASRPHTPLQPYAIPRFSMPETDAAFKSIVAGVERLMAGMRRMVPGRA